MRTRHGLLACSGLPARSGSRARRSLARRAFVARLGFLARRALVARLAFLAPPTLLALGCTQSGLDAPAPVPALDEPYFRCHVQPVVTQYCSAFACHGDARRYFHVYARNRLRLVPAGLDRVAEEQLRNSQLTGDERLSNFEAARAMVDAASPDTSWLLLKPLESSAGGYYHRGALIFNEGNVFATKADPGFVVLSSWVNGAVEPDRNCIEPGSDQ